MPYLSDFTGGDGVPTRWKALVRFGSPGSGSWVSTVTGYIRVHVQGPGGAGRRAPHNWLAGPGGGAGGRAIKTFKVSIGDTFTYSVAQGGQTEGANGAAATTFNAGAMVGNPGSGAASGLTGTSFGTGGGAGGTATGGDVNLAGGRGGHTANFQTSTETFAHGATGGGAPFSTPTGSYAGTTGLHARSAIATLNYALNYGVNRGGGRGGYFMSGEFSPLPGARGGGGGGGSGRATSFPTPANYFGMGGDGEIVIEIEDTSLRRVPSTFDGYKTSVPKQLFGDNASIYNDVMNMYQNKIYCTYIEVEEDVLVDGFVTWFRESTNNWPSYYRVGLYDANTRALVAQSGNLAMGAGQSGVVEIPLSVDWIKKGNYFIGIAFNGNNTYFDVRAYKALYAGALTSGTPVQDEYNSRFGEYAQSALTASGQRYWRNICYFDASAFTAGSLVLPSELPSFSEEISAQGFPAFYMKAK